MFKDVYKGALGEKAAQYQTVGFLVSSACAEVIADVLLCPMEAVSEPFCYDPLSFIYDCKLNIFVLSITVEGAHADL